MARDKGNPAHSGAKAQAAERRVLAFDLRKRGLSYREIAVKTKVSLKQAYDDVQETLQDLSKRELKAAEELRQLELERLDMVIKGLEPMAAIGHVPSVMAFIKASESRRKLLGLDMPSQVDVTSGGKAIPILITKMDVDEL